MTPTSTRLRFAALFVALAAAIPNAPPAGAATTTVQVPAGSVNALAAAIAQAGAGGTVLLKAGVHKEAGEVVVTTPVTITGESGAILQTATSPGYPNAFPLTIAAALHLKGAPGATVSGIWFQPPANTVGNCGVIVEDSPGARVLNNRMTQLAFGVIVQRGDNALIRGNSISTPANWDLDPSDPTYLADAEGVIVLTGQNVQVIGNQITNASPGIFLSDRSGEAAGNILTGSSAGIMFCHDPDTLYLFSGSKQASNQPATAWYVHDNLAFDNQWGVLVTDSAQYNTLANNDLFDNQVYDIELTGDTTRFAPVVPLAHAAANNLVVAGSYGGMVVKDCGQNNRIEGTVKLVDHTADPCN